MRRGRYGPAVLKIANAYYDRPVVERRLTPGQLRELTEVLCRRDADARKSSSVLPGPDPHHFAGPAADERRV